MRYLWSKDIFQALFIPESAFYDFGSFCFLVPIQSQTHKSAILNLIM